MTNNTFRSTFLVCIQVAAASLLMASASLPPKLAAPATRTHHGQKELALALIQASALVHTPARQAPNEPPRMYVAEGCDGSSANMDHAIKLLRLHGVKVGELLWEALDPEFNPYIKDANGNIIEAMRLMLESMKAKQENLVFKSILHRDMEATTNKALLDMGTLAVYVTRSNPLDHMVCMIRDCFVNTDETTTVYGYPVNHGGSPSNLCFERRSGQGHQTEGYKAYLKVNQINDPVTNGSLKENLEHFEAMTSNGFKELTKAGYPVSMIKSEDMEAFERGGEANIQTSLDAWTNLLAAWGVNANQEKVRNYLASQAGTWTPERQQDAIYNYEEVAAEVKRLGKAYMLRDD